MMKKIGSHMITPTTQLHNTPTLITPLPPHLICQPQCHPQSFIFRTLPTPMCLPMTPPTNPPCTLRTPKLNFPGVEPPPRWYKRPTLFCERAIYPVIVGGGIFHGFRAVEGTGGARQSSKDGCGSEGSETTFWRKGRFRIKSRPGKSHNQHQSHHRQWGKTDIINPLKHSPQYQ